MASFDTRALNAIEMEKVAARYGSVVRRGSHYMALCPWHDDHHESLLVSSKKGNRCKCMVCMKEGESKSVIDYVMAVRRCDFREACEALHRDFCIPMVENTRGGGASRQRATVPRKKALPYGGVKDVLERERGRRHDFVQLDATASYIPMAYVEEHMSADSTFCQCLRQMFIPEGVEYAVQEYRLGSYAMGDDRQGFVMFPSIDIHGRCHNIKIQRYTTDRGSPRFFHKEEDSTFWLATILQRRGKLPRDARYDCDCLFGEHLLAQYPDVPVVLVESPKNAVVGMCEVPSLLWLAAGNKSALTRSRLECLRNRKVIVIPDRDAVDEWRGRLSQLQDIATFELSTFCEDALLKEGEKGDVADYIISKETPALPTRGEGIELLTNLESRKK